MKTIDAYREGTILRSYVFDFLEWKEARIRRQPWLLFKGHRYWGVQLTAYVNGRIEQEATDKLFDTIKYGKTTLTDLAKLRGSL